MNEIEIDTSEHMSSELVTAWLDGELADEERARVTGHLADCDRCREEIVAVRQLLAQQPATGLPVRRRRTIRYFVGTAAAAAAVWFLLVPSVRGPDSRLRDGTSADAGAVPEVMVVAPVGDGARADGTSFTWRAMGRDAQYTLTLTDAAGALLWQISTPDTAIVLPDHVRLEADRAYFWTVDALLADGDAATSGMRGFETAP